MRTRQASRIAATSLGWVTAALSRVACVIPAKDDEQRIAATVTAARDLPGVDIVIVCDDGSSDRTADYAAGAGAIVVSHTRNRGKAAAVESAVNGLGVIEQRDNRPEAGCLLLLDADLSDSAANCAPLVTPVVKGEADLTIVTSDNPRSEDPDAIIAQHRRLRTSTLQLVDALPAGAHARLREALPGIRLVQVIHVVDGTAFDEALAVAEDVDAVLLDSGNPTLEVKELGGTGRRHDWSISARIVEALDVPVYLAGGLNPSNAAEAVATVQPFGLDVCTGVRGPDFALDVDKLDQFAAALAH